MSLYFLVTSAINTPYSQFTKEERIEQTLETAKSIKIKVENSIVILIDGGISQLDINVRETLLTVYDDILDFTQHEFIKFIQNQPSDNCGHMLKGPCESYLLREGCKAIASLNPERIFKISGRYKLNDKFNLNLHLTQSKKYVFLNRVKIDPICINDTIANWSDYCFETTFYSFCGSLLEETILNYDVVISNMLEIYSNNSYIDLETAMYISLDKSKVFETLNIGVSGILSLGWEINK